ncbi:hypothetical protein EVAR_100307_1 [Eumeta japonica]|uniref:Uncharacterized protein n=1 Tax=Eumeta variegata TaxID=151549 RepID=A0A4C1ZXA5_EUMVA|nr:hypothetical protein EVAR_100307_1 [Eumeta japonica]
MSQEHCRNTTVERISATRADSPERGGVRANKPERAALRGVLAFIRAEWPQNNFIGCRAAREGSGSELIQIMAVRN